MTRMEGVARAMVQLDERLTKQENALKVNAESISAIKQELLHVTRTVQNTQTADCYPSPQHPQHLTDDCEVLLSGLSLESTLTDSAILDKTLSNIGLPQHTRFITRTRGWSQKNQRKNPNSGHTRSLVFQCSSPVVRDTIISHSHKLSNIRTQSLFNTDGEGSLSLRPLWPKKVMPECARCKHSIAYSYVRCNGCSKCLHPGCIKPYVACSATLLCCKHSLSALDISPGLDNDGSRFRSSEAVAFSRAKARNTAVDASRGLTETDSIVPAGNQKASQEMAGDKELPSNEPTPQQLMGFLQRIDPKINKLTGHVQCIESFITRLETRIEAQETRTEQHDAEITEIRAVMGEIQVSLRSALASGPLNSTTTPTNSRMTDSCEILLTGLPIGVNLPKEEVQAIVFTAMGLKHFHKFLAHTRPWEPKSNRRSEPANTKAFVFTLSSPNMHALKALPSCRR
ncbi:unnamed protein product [Trichogramma brassicae]|uniref:Uncharacterized protein n=1 Tax=Trichogramma brassicae TaxID=86971 RepID=A0A6H5ICE8_9HYME|nr:unnamed protein product [Trichogramma brassicae]